MAAQSTRNILMIEPAFFGFNPETAATNDYQYEQHEGAKEVHQRALHEFRAYRDKLVEAGIRVLTVQGPAACPDAIFPNWSSHHEDGTTILYPMLMPNRRAERTEAVTGFFRRFYKMDETLVSREDDGKPLESTGSFVLDRVNKVMYMGRSPRSNEETARIYAQRFGYELIVFDTVDHSGNPVYHTDLVIWIGTKMAGIGAGMILEKDRARVVEKLSQTHELMHLTNEQIKNFCGNSIEALGQHDEPYLLMSATARSHLTPEQLKQINKHFKGIVSSPIPTIEANGGGSARCMVQELF